MRFLCSGTEMQSNTVMLPHCTLAIASLPRSFVPLRCVDVKRIREGNGGVGGGSSVKRGILNPTLTRPYTMRGNMTNYKAKTKTKNISKTKFCCISHTNPKLAVRVRIATLK